MQAMGVFHELFEEKWPRAIESVLWQTLSRAQGVEHNMTIRKTEYWSQIGLLKNNLYLTQLHVVN